MELVASPQEVEEHQLARNGASKTHQLQATNWRERVKQSTAIP